jgi:hypothetical protein
MTIAILTILAGLLIAGVGLIFLEVKKKNILIWLGNYITQKSPKIIKGPTHVMFMFVDHYEPGWNRPDYATEVRRVAEWSKRYPEMASKFRDSDGVHPQHTFFYPEEEYRHEHLRALEELARRNFGEIEVHLHHDNDTEEGLREKINRFVKILHNDHGALPVDPVSGKPVFAFIHGNWALDNSRADGRWCGVNNELSVLSDLGCYADFTLPSAPSETQTSTINSIYYATDHAHECKSHNTGTEVKVGGQASGDLLLIQGPLCFNWRDRKWGLLPKIENADIRSASPPTKERVDLWIKQHIHVQGRPEWIFVKIHTHGAQDHDLDTLLGEPIERMHEHLRDKYNDGEKYALHYVSSREAFNIIKAAEAGKSGNPNEWRNFILEKPKNRRTETIPD